MTQKKNNGTSPSSRKRKRSSSRSKHRGNKRRRTNSRSRDRKGRKERSRSKHRSNRRSKSGKRDKKKSKEKSRSSSRKRTTYEEENDKDARTLFAYNLPTNATERDVWKFFEKAGKVRDVRLISDKNSRKSKGFGYIEMDSLKSIAEAIQLSGTLFFGKTVMIQASQGERNYISSTTTGTTDKNSGSSQVPQGPSCLLISSLSTNVTEDDLRRIFDEYGEIEYIDIPKDINTGESKGYGHIQFKKSDYAKRAFTQMDSRDISGRPVKLKLVNESIMEKSDVGDFEEGHNLSLKDSESRVRLMARLQRDDEHLDQLNQSSLTKAKKTLDPENIPSKCIVIKNMFDSSKENKGFEIEIEDDVRDECSNFGSIKHIYVDKYSQGNVFLRFAMINAGIKAYEQLNGRWFNEKMLEVQYIPQDEYLKRFPL